MSIKIIYYVKNKNKYISIVISETKHYPSGAEKKKNKEHITEYNNKIFTAHQVLYKDKYNFYSAYIVFHSVNSISHYT